MWSCCKTILFVNIIHNQVFTISKPSKKQSNVSFLNEPDLDFDSKSL
ncbi:hypothetical protein BLGI_3557 [Brevibacillus laterosporus GI-9]|nr:hypothetical protein BLGI_3557 [Brevibacillus laterosporus GI-9]